MASENEALERAMRSEMSHFGDAERAAYQLGARHRVSRLALDAPERVEAALHAALEGHTYDATTRKILADEGRRSWHTLGSLMMTELLGHSAEAGPLGAAVDLLISFAIEQDILQKTEAKERAAQRSAEADALWARHIEHEFEDEVVFPETTTDRKLNG